MQVQILSLWYTGIIAELAERSPIIIQNGSSNPSSRKNLDLNKLELLTCVVNSTAGTPTPRLCPVVQWSVHWAPSRTTLVLVLVGARRCALGTGGEIYISFYGAVCNFVLSNSFAGGCLIFLRALL